MSIRNNKGSCGRVHAWRLALVLLALFASSAQQLVVQTHWHAQAVVHADTGADPRQPAAPDTRHDNCLLCQIAAHAAASAPPAALLLAVVPGDVPAVRVPQVSCLVPTAQPAHNWQSRGPPSA